MSYRTYPMLYAPRSKLKIMGTNILEQRMLEDTLGVFRDNTYTSVTEEQGVMLIDG